MTTVSPAIQPAPQSLTSREWTIPPRPKPGRKPATDTPPTKRKAQNREAQRAFRERRAARVGELEEQLQEAKDDQQRREATLRDQIVRLEADVQRFSGELQSWKLRCESLERMLDIEKGKKEVAVAELSYLRSGSRTTGTDAVPLPPRRHRHKQTPASPPPDELCARLAPQDLSLTCGDCVPGGPCACMEQVIEISKSGCGKCTPLTHCECLERTLRNAPPHTDVTLQLKRPRSVSPIASAEKRPRPLSDPHTQLEFDFTQHISSNPSNSQPTQQSTEHVTTRAPAETCGFCEAGTYCVCADTAIAANEREQENQLAPLLSEVTTPPPDHEVEGSQNKLPSLRPNTIHDPYPTASTNLCINGPGTCQQCQNDPKSGLFCRSLAALRESPGSSTPAGCCGGNGKGDGCCQSSFNASSNNPRNLSCADTYTTLSAHQNFIQASDDLNSWLGRLHTTPSHHPGRAPIEVEAASVMGVLKYFDRRFGRD